MERSLAEALLVILALYGAAGALFAGPFLARGAAAIDPGARGASRGFRIVVLPGVVAFWPLLARRWAAAARAAR